MRQLEVRLHGRIVGRIIETRKGGRFAYAPEIAAQRSGLPVLSLSMPAKSRPFGESKTSSWFEGLLPEGQRRDDICRSLGVSPYDWIGLLSEIGWECAGAVQVFPEGSAACHVGGYRKVGVSNLAEKLSSAVAHLPHPGGETFRISLGGFQDKVCVAMPRIGEWPHVLPDDIAFPEGDAPSTHILKPESPDYPGSAEAEAWALKVASHAARCSKAALLKLDGAPNTVVVERFDRRGSYPGKIERLHQEDACQALGIPPSRKYATEYAAKGDDPAYRAIADLLARYSVNPQEELLELLRQMVVNVVIGNWDAHAKNISLLYEDGSAPCVSPLYDVLPIDAIEPRTRLLSLRIDGRLDPGGITASSLLSEAVTWGLDEDACRSEIADCLSDIKRGIMTAAEAYPNAAARYEGRVMERIGRLGG